MGGVPASRRTRRERRAWLTPGVAVRNGGSREQGPDVIRPRLFRPGPRPQAAAPGLDDPRHDAQRREPLQIRGRRRGGRAVARRRSGGRARDGHPCAGVGGTRRAGRSDPRSHGGRHCPSRRAVRLGGLSLHHGRLRRSSGGMGGRIDAAGACDEARQDARGGGAPMAVRARPCAAHIQAGGDLRPRAGAVREGPARHGAQDREGGAGLQPDPCGRRRAGPGGVDRAARSGRGLQCLRRRSRAAPGRHRLRRGASRSAAAAGNPLRAGADDADGPQLLRRVEARRCCIRATATDSAHCWSARPAAAAAEAGRHSGPSADTGAAVPAAQP